MTRLYLLALAGITLLAPGGLAQYRYQSSSGNTHSSGATTIHPITPEQQQQQQQATSQHQNPHPPQHQQIHLATRSYSPAGAAKEGTGGDRTGSVVDSVSTVTTATGITVEVTLKRDTRLGYSSGGKQAVTLGQNGEKRSYSFTVDRLTDLVLTADSERIAIGNPTSQPCNASSASSSAATACPLCPSWACGGRADVRQVCSVAGLCVCNCGLVVSELKVEVAKPSNVLLTFRLTDLMGHPVPHLDPQDVHLFYAPDPFVKGARLERLDPRESMLTLQSSVSVGSAGEAPAPAPSTVAGVLVSVVIDRSCSVMQGAGAKVVESTLTDFILSVVNEESKYIHVSISAFDGAEKVTLIRDFTRDAAQLKQAVTAALQAGTDPRATNLNGAIAEGCQALQQAKAPQGVWVHQKHLVLFTDGEDNAKRLTTDEARAALAGCQRDDVRSSVVGLGDVDHDALRAIFGERSVFHANSVVELLQVFRIVARTIHAHIASVYTVGHCSPRRKGRTSLVLRIGGEGEGGGKAEVVVPFDASGFTGGCKLSGTPPPVCSAKTPDCCGAEGGKPKRGTN